MKRTACALAVLALLAVLAGCAGLDVRWAATITYNMPKDAVK
ncbi:MAG: hypothetical protein ACYC0T_21385 [Ramlibacter sp.]